MSEAPIACSLSAAEQARRLETSGAIADGAMLDATVTDRGASIRFRPEAEAELRELIEAESRCCGFLDFDLRVEGEALRLRVEGPDGAQPIILALFGLEREGMVR